MTVGNPTKLILRFIVPLLLGNIFQQLYSMVDAIIVGQYVGSDALAGIGSTGAIIFFIVGFATGLTNGFAVPMAQSYGAQDMKRLKKFVAMSCYLCVFFAILLTTLSVLFIEPLLDLMQTPAEIHDYAYNYIIVILVGLFATITYNMNASTLRAVGDSRTPLLFLVIASILNIFLDIVFIVNFDMGVAGAGYATVISQGVASILCIIYMQKKFEILRLSKQDFKVNFDIIKNLVTIGVPMAFQFTIIATGSIILQSVINTLGTSAVAAYTICSKIEQLAIQPFVTLGIVSTTYTAQNIGAGKFDRVRDGMKRMFIIGVIISVGGGILIHSFNDQLINAFLAEEERLVEVITFAKQYLAWSCGFFFPLMCLILFRGAIQGMGDVKFPTVAGIIELLGRVLTATGLVHTLGFTAVCIACPTAWSGASMLVITVFLGKLKKLNIS
ncbi:MAG: MATE family efflux transporter [bacterium]